MSQNAEVIVVGQALLDCILKGWNTTPKNGSVYMADSVSIIPGGDAVNESITIAKLGHSVKIHCGLGKDLAGGIVRDLLTNNGVDLSEVVWSEDGRTPITNLIVDQKGERRSVNTPAHLVPFFTPDETIFEGAKVVTIASLFRAPFHKVENIVRLAKAVKAAGAVLIADFKIANCDQLTLEDIKEALPYIDYVFPNETEAAFYTGETDYVKMADKLLAYGVKNVIIKVGPQGCIVKNNRECFAVPAYDIQAVDGTGAGDNFLAGFVSSLIHGIELHEAMEIATACAAICVQSLGATTGVKSLEQVMEYRKTGVARKAPYPL
ncbi:MAG: carbohydrate kinase family protein [Lachnospiraceae bacterium]|nr:carbohydrate kinase family protein [Lachnospiraceae bacterium]